ncbi:universal stress protein [bacterium]|nr:universal stress protein [bacterium]MBU1752285.1 universal stress protein [bacterium]
MGRYNKILVPFDGSASSKNALFEVVKLQQSAILGEQLPE